MNKELERLVNALEDIAGTTNLTATPKQFADHLQREARKALDEFKAQIAQAEPVAWQYCQHQYGEREDCKGYLFVGFCENRPSDSPNGYEWVRPLYADPQPKPEPDLVGRRVSVDVSTGDHDAGHRIFARIIQADNADPEHTILAVEESRNFAIAEPTEQELREASGKVAAAKMTSHLDEIDAPGWEWLTGIAAGLSEDEKAHAKIESFPHEGVGNVVVLWQSCAVRAMTVTVRDDFNRTKCLRAEWAPELTDQEYREAIDRHQADMLLMASRGMP